MNFRNVERFVTSRPRSRRYLAVATTLMMAMTTQYLLAPVASATSVCRWINEKGQTKLSDIVPDRYRSIVSCTHSEAIIEPSAKQRTDAETTQRRNAALNPPAKSASTQAASENAALQPALKQPAELVTEKTDCKTWQRIYEESGACFAPFRTAKGGIKAEAFSKCNEVPNPEQKCGPQRN